MTKDYPSADIIGLVARTGLSRRDIEAFIDAWERAGRPGTLEEFLGFVPEQRSVNSANRDDPTARRHA